MRHEPTLILIGHTSARPFIIFILNFPLILLSLHELLSLLLDRQ